MSVWIAGPLISGMFIPGTASDLTFVKPADVDLVVTITQVRSIGAPGLKMIAALLLIVTLMTGNSLSFSTIIRLPMVTVTSGFLMAILYVALSLIPIAGVGNSMAFTRKIIGVVAVFQFAGAVRFRYANKRHEIEAAF